MLAWTVYISFLAVLVLLLPQVSVRAARVIALLTALAGLAITLVAFTQQPKRRDGYGRARALDSVAWH